MRFTPHLKAPALVLLLSAAPHCGAQTGASVDSALNAIQQLYDNGMFVSSELEARRLLEQKPLSDSIIVLLERHIACSLVAQGRTQSAVEHFIAIMKHDSNFELDPILTSPKILTVFNQAKTLFLSEKRRDVITVQKVDSITMRSVSFRTIVFPGWEQLYQGRASSGYLFLSSGALSLGLTVAFDIQRRDARRLYLEASTVELAQERYSAYDKYYKAEAYSAVAFGLIYLASELDVFLNSSSSSLAFQNDPSSKSGPQFSLLISF